ncbi:Glutathione S-transferase Mu 4 [Cichlidogyrus casuarinus]|uniref:glutathione transferase n=1 Tax=Cichlidogyrus casuarinus TaxID=1844966 RepID=A0ABD2QK27_9PLAT
MAPSLGYWKIRGLLQPTRLMMEYAGMEYKEKFYTPETANEWFAKDKSALGLDFPNLPYYTDGDFKLTESRAIHRYVAGKCSLQGSTPEIQAHMDMVIGVLYDLKTLMARIVYNKDVDWPSTGKQQVIEGSKHFLDELSKYLGTKHFFGGNSPLTADFVAFDFIHAFCYIDKSLVAQNLIEFIKRFMELPKIKQYMASDKFIAWPINGFIATFGGTGAEPKFTL